MTMKHVEKQHRQSMQTTFVKQTDSENLSKLWSNLWLEKSGNNSLIFPMHAHESSS